MVRRRQNWIAIGAVAVLGLLAGLQHWIAGRRPVLSEFAAALEFSVTSSADYGPGSLREAVFAADTANKRARIVFHVQRAALASPLPPLVNPEGIVMEGPSEGVELQASRVRSGPILDINSPHSVLRGIRIVNSSEQGILVRSTGFHLLNAKISGCDVGLQALEGATDLVVEQAGFDRNRIAIRLDPAASGVTLKGNHFRGQTDAALWVVDSKPGPHSGAVLDVKQNSFDGNRLGAVIGNVPALIEDNEFLDSSEAALFLIGDGARVRGNRIRGGAAIGVFADTTEGTVIESNELDHNRTIGVLVRYSRDAIVQRNRIYANGYGIAFVLGQVKTPSVASENTLLDQVFDGIILIGDSPVIRHNRLLGNHQAGLRILDFFPRGGDLIASNPYLDSNTLKANEFDEPVHGEYRVKDPGRQKP